MKRFKEILESGEPAMGAAILYECPEMIESLAGQEWDWIWLDGQHALREHTWVEHLRACQILGANHVLRLPGDDWHLIGTALDWGAWNLMIPVVELELDYGRRPEGSASKLNTYSDGFRIMMMFAMLLKS